MRVTSFMPDAGRPSAPTVTKADARATPLSLESDQAARRAEAHLLG
jgi:hypothetical protein